MLTILVPGFSPARAEPFDLPDPEVYVRAEDRERARLIVEPCTKADVGRGCYRENGYLLRESPCGYRVDKETIGFLPTDECYRMDPPRRYRGVWIDEFEGQRFIPEGTSPPEWPELNSNAPDLREQFENARLAAIWLDTERVEIPRPSGSDATRYFIEFVGRQTMFPGAYSHLGMSGHEIIVDQVIALRVCPPSGPCN
jgi:hypothetical protein